MRTIEEENEFEMLEAMKKMNVDDERGDEEDMNELVNAMGRLQIHEKVKASRCRFLVTYQTVKERRAICRWRALRPLNGKQWRQSMTRRN